MTSVWTDDLKQEVFALWNRNSASMIAGQLHARGYTFSRNSIIGIIHRAGLTSPKSVPTFSKPRTPRENRPVGSLAYKAIHAIKRKKREALHGFKIDDYTPPTHAELDAAAKHISLLELTDTACKWPYGGYDAPITFCGCDKISDGPYCYGHEVISKQPPSYRTRSYADIGKGRGSVFGKVA